MGLVGGWVHGALGQQPAKTTGKESEKSSRKALKPVPPAIPTVLKNDQRISRSLEALRNEYQLPGMIGAILKGNALTAIGAAGVRKLGSADPILIGDTIHLGSNTKAMTATLLATFVDEGKLSWTSRIRDVFPARSKEIHADFKDVTLGQLLTHRAGLPHDGPWWALNGRTTTEKRRDLLSRMMKDAPLSKPGTTQAYSNVGYAIAGLMAEQVAERSWESLMQERLFTPLGMTSAGFGPPGTPAGIDAPWGHQEKDGETVPIRGDNAPPLGPAGTVHVTIPDWAKFVALHLLGAQGKANLLKPATFRILHTPAPGTEYAGGWYVFERSWAGGRALMHSGSNTMWYCTVWIAPLRGFAAFIATNQGGSKAAKACDESFSTLIPMALASGTGGTPKRRSSRS
jgi:CubicO group peptidase (beta-lactamase class C family)